MNKREAKRWACKRAWELLNLDHDNGFLYEDEGTPDGERKLAAWEELIDELWRRCGESEE
jgi:hypothetical protein